MEKPVKMMEDGKEEAPAPSPGRLFNYSYLKKEWDACNGGFIEKI